jgi:death-on-curing protein
MTTVPTKRPTLNAILPILTTSSKSRNGYSMNSPSANNDKHTDDQHDNIHDDQHDDYAYVDDPDVIITINDLYNLNESVVGGLVFVRDDHLLRSAVRRPFISLFGVPQFPTLIDKAAALMHSIAAHHLFVDGNKRTAEKAARLFLESNGITPTWDEHQAHAFLLQVAQGEHTAEDVATWLDEHTNS